jgi:hypothetical protein
VEQTYNGEHEYLSIGTWHFVLCVNVHLTFKPQNSTNVCQLLIVREQMDAMDGQEFEDSQER